MLVSALARSIPILIFALVAAPFPLVLQMPIAAATVTLPELVLLAIGAVLVFEVILAGRLTKFWWMLAALVAVLLLSLVYSQWLFGVNLARYLSQLRWYLPFLVAVFALAVPIRTRLEDLLVTVGLATGLSAALSLVAHYIAPGILRQMISTTGNADLEEIVLEHGRLYFYSAALAFFVPLAYQFAKRRLTKFALALALLFSAWALAATLNRTLLLGALLLVTILALWPHSTSSYVKRLKILLGGILVICLAYGLTLAIDPRAAALFGVRFLEGDSAAVFERAIVINRLHSYEQYLYTIAHHPWLGIGLGQPLSVDALGNELPISDVSLVSFLIPFGIPGLMLFLGLLFALNSAFSSLSHSSAARRYMLATLWITALMSLNIDLYSRNTLVVVLAVLASAATSSRMRYRSGAAHLTAPPRSADGNHKTLPRQI